jgi:beta-lactamase superfamily II metal-dependent hydrolase
MPHHGSTANLMDQFVEKLAPETILVSCSQSRQPNTYKPKNAVNGFYTPVNGAITVTISPEGDITTTGFMSVN